LEPQLLTAALRLTLTPYALDAAAHICVVRISVRREFFAPRGALVPTKMAFVAVNGVTTWSQALARTAPPKMLSPIEFGQRAQVERGGPWMYATVTKTIRLSLVAGRLFFLKPDARAGKRGSCTTFTASEQMEKRTGSNFPQP